MLLAQVDDDDAQCDAYPEILQATMGELGELVNDSIWMLSTIRTVSPNLAAVAEATALSRIWVDNWTPYQNIPITYLVANIVPAEVQERFCGLIGKTVAVAERVYMADKSGQIAQNYGDVLAVLRKLKERVSPSPAAKGGHGMALFLVGAVVLAGAAGVVVAMHRHRRAPTLAR